ncbi:hypothetical protein [Nostoc mirabile]|nr:hypothetical protein [Nostoc mirabile]
MEKNQRKIKLGQGLILNIDSTTFTAKYLFDIGMAVEGIYAT